MDLSKYDICYEHAITSWDMGLPLGNGRLGCIVYGEDAIYLAVDRIDLWDTREHPNTLEAGFCYKNLVKLSKLRTEEAWKERERLFEKIYDELSYPSKISAGHFKLDYGCELQNVHAKIDLKSAIGEMHFDGGEIELFMDAWKPVGAARIKGDFRSELCIPEYISSDCHNEREMFKDGGQITPTCGMGYPQADIKKEDGFLYYIQETKSEFSYGVFAYTVLKKEFAEIYFTIKTSKDGDDFDRIAKEELKEAARTGYDKLKEEHIKWWKKYWEKASLKINDELLEKTYYRSWYLFASCSRKGNYPMPLQGVWTADDGKIPPWRGDYHHDTNTQLSYQAYLKADRLAEGEVFLDYLWNLKPRFEQFANEFYGVDGLLIPGVSTIDGKPMGGWSQYALSPTMSIWVALSFDEYYLYTGDVLFLKEKAYPFFYEVGKAIMGLLEEKNGKLYLPLSTSPEIYDDTPEAYLIPNSNFDLALIRYLFVRLQEYSEILNKEKTAYEEILSKLDEIAVIDGYIGLNRVERLKESHRHFSHLMCLYPLHLIHYDTKEHRELYKKALSEIEKLGTGMWVGFSFAMCAQLYAMAENGAGAYEKLRQFADGFVEENGFHLNGDYKQKGYSTFHYRRFTLEALFGFCDALQEMLLQEYRGYLHLFPAIPKQWENEGIEEKDIAQHDINVSAMNYEAEIQESYPDKEIKLLSLSVSVGPRNITYYVIDRKNLTQMFFINAFNVFELFEIQGVTTAKTTVERDTAVINRRETFYDRTIEKKYEVQTSALSSPVKDWVEQFLFSPLVKMFDPDADSINEMTEVLITESACEISNSNTELGKVKFTWKYADVYPRLNSIDRETKDLFSQQFEFQFK